MPRPTERNFSPRRFLRGGHIQTLASFFLPRRITIPPFEDRLIEVEPGVQVLCRCHWQPDRENALTTIIVHGLEGSSESGYMLGIAAKGIAAGMNVVRMNQRNCGGTDALSSTLYHSGRSNDVAAVAQHLIDHDRISRLYEHHFMWKLRQRLRQKARLFPNVFDTSRLRGIRSLREFDDKITAYYCGFDGASDYYQRSSAANVIDRIAVPTLILQAANDPFIRILPETHQKILANSNITFIETEDGGHCSFLTQPDGNDGYWAEQQVVDFLRQF